MGENRVQVFKSLQWRLVFIFVLITSSLMIVAGVSINYSVQSSYYNTFKTRIEKGFDEWRLGENPTAQEIEKYLREDKNAIFLFLITEYKTYTIIEKSTNKIVYSSDKLFEVNEEKLLNQIQASENYVAALAGNIGDKDKLLSFENKEYLDYAKSEGNFILYFRYDKDDWKGTIDQFNDIIKLSFLIAVSMALVLGFLLSKTITTPIINLMNKAKKIAEGDFEQVLDVKSDDEIGKLTQNFNYMAKELKMKITEIQKEKNKIETILFYMTDGVIAFDIMGNIIHVNPISKLILENNDFNYRFNEIVEKYKLDIEMKDVLNLKAFETIERNIKIKDKYLKMQAGNFNEGILLIIQDNTKQQKLENMRKDFVANVSHELRTPLTSIKSYAETLLDSDFTDQDMSIRFLTVINSEADRMARLVNDLLQLTKIDNNRMNWTKSYVDINCLLESITEKMKISMSNKNLILSVLLKKNLPKVYVDKDRIEQVIVNILSNAIKYTPEGGKIKITTNINLEYLIIKVKDTGIGIPKSDIPRICERFYRVDKARSREQGGTGLGLSIAKEILEEHNGKIEIKSEINKGTIVTIYIPMNKSLSNNTEKSL